MSIEKPIFRVNRVQLSQLSKIIFQGLFPSRATKPNDSNRRIPIIDIKDIVNGQVNPDDIDIIVIDANKILRGILSFLVMLLLHAGGRS